MSAKKASQGYLLFTPTQPPIATIASIAPIATKSAVGDGILWATPCKRGEAEAQLGDSRSRAIVAQVGMAWI
ncbi:MAG: hypothetical protein SOX83_04765 [Sodaliphilus sp.]|nr:hypothetical protein [Sodaliphilus sp.]